MTLGVTAGAGPASLDTIIPPATPSASASASANHLKGYETDALDGILTVRVAEGYASRNEYMSRIRLIDSKFTGRLLLDTWAAIGQKHGTYLVFDSVRPSRDPAAGLHAAGLDAVAVQGQSAIRVEDNLYIWDPLLLPLDPSSPDYENQHQQVVISLAELCKQLVSVNPRYSLGFDLEGIISPPDPQASSVPSGSAPVLERPILEGEDRTFRPYQLPIWRGETIAISVTDDLVVHMSMNLARDRFHLAVVLDDIAKTQAGAALMRDLIRYKQKGKILTVAEGKGKSGLTKTEDGTLAWMFSVSDLKRRCLSPGLRSEQKRAYIAYIDLLKVRDKFASELDPSAPRLLGPKAADQFYREIKLAGDDPLANSQSSPPAPPPRDASLSGIEPERPGQAGAGRSGNGPRSLRASGDSGHGLVSQATPRGGNPLRRAGQWVSNAMHSVLGRSGSRAAGPDVIDGQSTRDAPFAAGRIARAPGNVYSPEPKR